MENDFEASRLPGPSRKGQGRSSLPAPSQKQPPATQQFVVGDHVSISGVKKGRVLYFGKILLKAGLWCGIELEEPVGKHDGEVEGVRYFTAKPGHGIFAPVDRVSLVSKEDVNLPTSPAKEQEKVFRSKLQRRTLHYPKPAAQLTKEPEKGSSESISSQSETGSEASSCKISNAESSDASLAQEFKKPKLSFLRKPSAFPKSGQSVRPGEVLSPPHSSGVNHTSGLPKPKAASGKGLRYQVDSKPQGIGRATVNQAKVTESALNATQILESHERDSEDFIDTSDLANRTRILHTEDTDSLNKTRVIEDSCPAANQTRVFEKRSQPDHDNPNSEQDVKRPRLSPVSPLPQSGKAVSRIATERASGESTNLNSTFMTIPSHKQLPVVSGSVKANDTFSVPVSADTEYEESQAFSPEVHRQLVAGGRQYMNLTFDADAKEPDCGNALGNLTHIVASPISAKSDETCKSDSHSGEELSELDSTLWFLKGDRLIGEATRLGLLKPEELANTQLISDSLLMAGGEDSFESAMVNKETSSEVDLLCIEDEHQPVLEESVIQSSQGIDGASSLGLLKSGWITMADGSNLLADNPRLQELRQQDSRQASRLPSTGSDCFVDGDKILAADARALRIASVGSDENFALSKSIITSTPVVVTNPMRKMDTRGIETHAYDPVASTPKPLPQKRLSCPVGLSPLVVRRSLDLTNNASEEPETGPAEHTSYGPTGSQPTTDELQGPTGSQPTTDELQGPTGSQPTTDELQGPTGSQPTMDELQAPSGSQRTTDELQGPSGSQPTTDELQGQALVTACSLTSGGSGGTPAVMHTSLTALPDLVKAESMPMTDSGIDNVMTASQEMVSSQPSVDKLQQILDERNQLAADLIAGHSKTERPLSLISSISSVDTGYVPDTGSERGTLTTNSPSEWLEKYPGQTLEDWQKNLAYAETFQNYQEGLMKGLTLAGRMENNADVCTDVPSVTDKDETDVEHMDTICKAPEEEFEAVPGEEASETESSNDITEIMTLKDQKSERDVLGENSKERGEQNMDTAFGVESEDAACKMEHDGDQEDNAEENQKDNDSTSKEDRKAEKDLKSKSKLKKSKKLVSTEHKKPNVNVGSKLAEYLKTPSKPKEDSSESVSKDKKNLTNKKRVDSSEEKSKSPASKSEDKVEDGESKPSRRERVKAPKEPPKVIKRTAPKSKWGDIMSSIEAHKESPPKPKEKVVKSHLESIFSQAPPPKPEAKKAETKVPKKKLQSLPRPDYSQVKSRLSTQPSKIASSVVRRRTGSTSSTGAVPPHLDFSNSVNGSINDSAMSSARSSRSDVSNLGISGLGSTEQKHKGKPANHKASSLMRLERPNSASSNRSEDVSMNSTKAMNEKNIQKSPRRKSEIKSSIPPIAPRRPSPAKSSPARSSPAKSSGKSSDASTSKQSTKSTSATKRPPSSSHQNRNKNVKSKAVSNHKSFETEQEKRAKAEEEVSRLKALCESRTTAFEAMSVLVNYLTQELDAFSCPVIKAKLDTAQKVLSDTQAQLRNLEERNQNLQEEAVSLNKQHEATLASLNSEHADKMLEAMKVQTEEHKEKVRRVKEKHSREIENLRNYHDRHIKEIGLDNDEKTHQLKLSHIEENRSLQNKHENQMEELHRQHRDKLEDITLRFESIKMSLSEKVESLRGECDDLRNRARLSEEALHRDTDVKVRMALEPYKNLPKEIESLKLVIDLRNEEIRDLRRQKIEIEKQLEELPVARDKCISLEQHMENLEAIVKIKTDHEKQLSDKCSLLMRKYDQENKQNKRLSMNVEELMWKMSEPGSEFSSTESLSINRQLSHSPPSSEGGGERRVKSWSSCSDTSLSPCVLRRNGDSTQDRTFKRRSGPVRLETINQSAASSSSSSSSRRSPMSRSFNDSILSHYDSSMSEMDPFDGPHGLPPPPEPQECQSKEEEVAACEDIDVEIEVPEEEESSVSTTDTTSSETGVQESVV